MNRKILVLFFVLLCVNLYAQSGPAETVRLFGESLSLWCSTDDIHCREQIEKLCSGLTSCRVEDKVHSDYQISRGLRNYETFVLDSYLNMFQTMIPEGISFKMSNIKEETRDELPGHTLTFITADITFSGAMNYKVKDLFLVRDNKISGIYTYSSQLGFSHLNGSLIRALEIGRYRLADQFDNGYIRVRNEGGKQGLIDYKGNTIVPCMWDAIRYGGGDFAEGDDSFNDIHVVYDLRRGGRITPLHRTETFYFGDNDVATSFSDGYAVVYFGGKYGYLREDDGDYNSVHYIYDRAKLFLGGYALVEQNGYNMVIDKNFRIVLHDTDSYFLCGSLCDGLAKVQSSKSGKVGFVNKNGEIVIPCIYDAAEDFSNEVCIVSLATNEYPFIRSGYINTTGKVIIPIIYNGVRGNFEDGYVEVYRKDGKGTLLGYDGNPLTGFSWKYDFVRKFSCGLARFGSIGNFGFLNKKGEVAIPPVYDFASFFVHGIACVRKYKDGKYGGINKEGALVIPYLYDKPFYFNEHGIALVEKDGKVGLIDLYGNSSFLRRSE